MPAQQTIAAEVATWPGTSTEFNPEYRHLAFIVGRREIGHLHGDRTAHFGFPKAVWHELHDAGRIDYHPVFPGRPGFGARAIVSDEDVDDVIALLRLNYERAMARGAAQART